MILPKVTQENIHTDIFGINQKLNLPQFEIMAEKYDQNMLNGCKLILKRLKKYK